MTKNQVKFMLLGVGMAVGGGLLLLANGSAIDPTVELLVSGPGQQVQVAARPSEKQPVLVVSEAEPMSLVIAPKPALVTLALAEFAGFGHDVEADEQRFEEEELAREEFISQCMQEMGFTYLPAPSVALDDIESLEREAFNAAMAEAATDPNEAYIRSLPPTMLETYYVALVGVPDPNASEAADLPDFKTGGGCLGDALRKIPGVYAAFAELRQEFDAMEDNFRQDPRVATANMAWSRCMENRGLQFTSPSMLRAALDESGMKLRQSEVDDAQFSQLQTEQQQMVASERSCDESTALTETLDTIRVVYETEFVREHGEILASYRKVGSGQGAE